MGKQDIVQVILADGTVKVIFLDENATAKILIRSVIEELYPDEEIKEEEFENWKVIFLSPLERNLYKVIPEDIGQTDDISVSRYLNEDEVIFLQLEKLRNSEISKEINSSKSVQDIHDLSQHLHRPCFKIVNINHRIAINVKDKHEIENENILNLYITENMNTTELVKIIEESIPSANNQGNKTLALSKVTSDGEISKTPVTESEVIYQLILELNEEEANGKINGYQFEYCEPDGWFSKMGSITSRLSKNLSRPLSVYTFFGGNTTENKPQDHLRQRHENLVKRRIANPSRMVRHMSLSGKDSESNIDLSTITTWISADAIKSRKQNSEDPQPITEWAATYPITRGLKQRQNLPTTNEDMTIGFGDEQEIDHIDELTEELNELDKAFLEVLDELNIKDAVREKMMDFPPAKKLELIEQNEMVRRMKAPNNQKSNLQSSSMSRPNSIIGNSISPTPLVDTPPSAAQASLESLLSAEQKSPPPPSASSGISNFLFGSLFSSSNSYPEGSVEYYLNLLNTKNLSPNDTFKCLQTLRIHLSTAAVTWVRNFLDGGYALSGVEHLLEKYIDKNIALAEGTNSVKILDIDEEIHLECIRCLRVLLNTEIGFHEVLKHPIIIQYLTFSINTSNDKIRKIATEVLAAICVLSKEGHSQILDSLSDFRLKFHEEYRFQYLLHSLEAHVSLEGISAIAAYEYKTTCLSFINALVNSPETLDERMLLREEFHRRGLKEVFQELRDSYPPESLVKQIICYEEELEADKADLKEQILIQTLDSDPNHPFLKLSNYAKQLPTESILKTLTNDIVMSISSILSNEYPDELRYEIANLVSMFCHHALSPKDHDDWNVCLKPFFEEASEFVGLDLREILETTDDFKKEMEQFRQAQDKVIDLTTKLERSEKELKHLKSIPVINYFIELENKEPDDIDLTKSPKDNFTSLVQRLVNKEKEITKLTERIERLTSLKSESEATDVKKFGTPRSALKEELDLQRQENKELLATVDSKSKEIAYLKRSLEAVCARFQLQVNEFVPDNNSALDNKNTAESGVPNDLISISELQVLQAELELAREQLSSKESLEKELESLKESASLYKDQIQNLEIKLKEKECVQSNSIKLQSINKEEEVKPMAPPPPPPPPLPVSSNINMSIKSIPPPPPPLPTSGLPLKSTKNHTFDPDSSQIGKPLLPPPPPPLPEDKKPNPVASNLPIPPPLPPGSSLEKITPPPPPPPPMPSIPQRLGSGPVNLSLSQGPPAPPPPPGPPAPPAPDAFNPFSIRRPTKFGTISNSPTINDIKPRVPMKALFWKKLTSAKILNTIWELNTITNVLDSLDIEEFEALFAKKVTKKPGSGYSSIGRKIKGKKSITLLDLTRANNIAIALARMKVPFPAIRQAILEINDNRLSIDNLRSLENIAPTSDEIKLIKAYTGSIDNLGTAEKYFLQIMDISRLQERLGCMIFRRRFESDIDDLKPELSVLNQVIEELKSSKRLSLLLEIVLALGNYLNANTPRGNASGFKLEALKQLKDVKASTNKESRQISSLLHYLAQILEDKWDDVLKVREDFKHLEAAARVSVGTLLNNVFSLTEGVKRVQKEIEAHKKIPIVPENDRFVSTMEKFDTMASPLVQNLKESSEKLENNLDQLLSYFGEDSTSTKPEDFFNLIISFLDSLETAKQDNAKAREKANKSQHQTKSSIASIDKGKQTGFGQGDFDVAIRELRSGLRRKRTDRPRSGLFSIQALGKVFPNEGNES